MQQTPRAAKAVLTNDICRVGKVLCAELDGAMAVAYLLERFGQRFDVFADYVLVGRDCLLRVEGHDSAATLAVKVMGNGTKGSSKSVLSFSRLCNRVELLPSPVPAMLAAGGYLSRI